MPEYLNSNRNKVLTQEEVERYVADEPDRKPFSGAGSMDGRWKIGQRGNRPMSAREQLGHKERAEFAAANPDEVPTRPLTAEELAWAEKTAKDAVELDAYNEYLREAIKSGKPVEWAWDQTFPGQPCVLLKDVPRSTDRKDFNDADVGVAARFLRDAEMFANYKSSGENPRTDLMFKVIKQLLEFQHANFLDTTSPQSWLRSFLISRNLNLLPTPLPTQAQLNAMPADDGEPVALHDDGITPVTYTVRGKVVRYSNTMLQALTSAGYETVMNLKRVAGRYGTADPATRRALAVEAAQTQTNHGVAEDGNPIEIMDGAPFVVNGRKYSNQMIDKLSGDEYRKLMRLPRGSSKQGAMQS
jgi:hypothetical protein